MTPSLSYSNGREHSEPNINSNGTHGVSHDAASARIPIVDPTAMRRPVDAVHVDSDRTSYTVSCYFFVA